MDRKPTLFVSYASDDAHAISVVVPLLKALGFECWWDERLMAGRDYHDAIQDAMRSADGIVAVWSPAYLRDRSYALREFRFARFTLERQDLAIVLLDRISMQSLDISMTELNVPAVALSESSNEDRLLLVAGALAAAGIRLPNGAPTRRPQQVDEEARLILAFDRIAHEGQAELATRISRLQAILAANPASPFHAMNAALLWLHSGNANVAGEFAQRALASRPDSGEIAYFSALVALAMEPVVRGPRERIAAIWELAERAMLLGYVSGLPRLIQAALAIDYHERNGSRAPCSGQQAMIAAHGLPIEGSELRRLLSVLTSVAPVFSARLRA